MHQKGQERTWEDRLWGGRFSEYGMRAGSGDGSTNGGKMPNARRVFAAGFDNRQDIACAGWGDREWLLWLGLEQGTKGWSLKNSKYWNNIRIEIKTKINFCALTGVAQWVEHHPTNQKSPAQFPVRAHAWVVGQVLSPVRGMQEATNRCFSHTSMYFSLSFSLPSEKTSKLEGLVDSKISLRIKIER